MDQTIQSQPQQTARNGFGFQPRQRRKKIPSPTTQEGKTDADLIADFIAKKGITKCATRFAEGAREASGDFEF